eukprot:CAMPEP_0197075902 /NCGR_PEP_ID=MMETSP1384-20130603/211844_1 /TAXON_ID=29189 /ORGANISM="Ammonia sp." /LENGTH=710 /DNA_ID=CAMNT_0042514751 /DNA_START=22 /DNA_END=2151 /DNA_ORIENTATION=+
MAALQQPDKQWSWFEEQVNLNYKKFTTKQNVNIFVGTWNVNAKDPKDDITSWLIDQNGNFDADIYVLGFQEIVDLNAANLWIENTANEGWERLIESCLQKSIPNHQFVQLESRHLVGILLCVYVKKSLRAKIKNVMTSMVGVGLFGTAGNKGGVGIRMQVFDSDLCFICSHLAAHKNNVQGRNQDFLKIIENMKFRENNNNNPYSNEQQQQQQQQQFANNNNLGASGMDQSASMQQRRNQDFLKIIENMKFRENNNNNPYSNEQQQQQQQQQFANNNSSMDQTASMQQQQQQEEEEEDQSLSVISNHDMVIWLGDLNYRLNFESLEEVFAKIKERDWPTLLLKDQLNVERKNKRAFDKFIEEEITFDPTYKFQPGTSVYEQRPDKKKRFPAWCDRILWRTGSKKTTEIGDIRCARYSTSMDQKMSDHKPVYAHLHFAANIFDMAKRAEMRKQIMKKKDKTDNNQLPQIEIEPEVSFPLIKFCEPERKKFVIHNTGQVAVSFRFTHAEHKASMPKWLKISPQRDVILPGANRTCHFEIHVDRHTVKTIPHTNRLEETVLLRIENSSDNVVPMKFVVVTAKYLTSCFGNKIEKLVKYRKPIRYIEDLTVSDSHSAATLLNEEALSIPKELWRLIDHLYKYGMDTEMIFIQRGIETEISEIRECLDTGKAFARYELHSVGEALVRFLESQQDAVFAASLCDSYKEKEIEMTQW